MKKINIFSLIAILLGVIWLSLQSFHVLHQPFLGTDFVSWALQSMAGIWDIGSSYANYWNINPPGLMIMTTLWGLFFGGSFLSFHWLYLLSLTGILFLTWQVLGRLFSKSKQLIIYVIFGVIFFSNTLQTQFFPSEINGLLFTLLGLWFALRSVKPDKNLVWASFFLILAGQMKEVYLPVVIILLPHLLVSIHQGSKVVKRFLASVVKGALLAIGLHAGYLLLTQSVFSYLEILLVKAQQFPLSPSQIGHNLYSAIHFPKDLFTFISYPLYLFFGGSLAIGLYWLSTNLKSTLAKKSQQVSLKLDFKVSQRSFYYLVVGCYWLGSVLGYAMQGRLGNKYEIPMLLPTLLVIVAISEPIISYLWKILPFKWSKNGFLQTALSLALVIALIFPKQDFLAEFGQRASAYSPQQHLELYRQAKNYQLETDNYIKENTSQDDCLTAVYGWGMGTVYYYSQRQSCSRFFLVNILPDSKTKEYQQDLLNNPPAVIFYTDQATDMNVEDFENRVFNFSAVLDECYLQDGKYHNLYWPVTDHLDECLKIGLPN